AYAWSASVDPESLADGPHTLTATLLLNGAPAATQTVTVEIDRPDVPRTYEVVVTSPVPGATVPRETIQVAGTTFTDDPSGDRKVTVELLGPEPMPEAPATGVETWAADVSFDRVAGDYTIVARLLVDGDPRATHQVEVVIPPMIDTGQISCAPGTVRFWRHEFGSSRSPHGFTAPERALLLDRAVVLSDGLFGTGEEMLGALLYSGKPVPLAVATRQFAALLLNLAAGDLSATMSHQVGLSGGEGLDPAVHDTAVVGETVNRASAWIRSQLPRGDLGGANEVADALNNGIGLLC
ncbi:MAG: hypothetical protein M3245_01495, partial [Actinomycetota bacterium]|nr:hypothetical protein [Actinomycetota bacterium]